MHSTENTLKTLICASGDIKTVYGESVGAAGPSQSSFGQGGGFRSI